MEKRIGVWVEEGAVVWGRKCLEWRKEGVGEDLIPILILTLILILILILKLILILILRQPPILLLTLIIKVRVLSAEMDESVYLYSCLQT